MKAGYYLTFLVLVAMASNHSFARVAEQPSCPVEQAFYAPYKIIEVFLRAVNRGELVVFEQTLDESMLIPVRVEYVYELGSTNQRVKVYSELVQPLPVPARESIQFRGVSAILNAEGHIIEVEAHVWAGE
jgi:hypothetical protein